MDLPLVSTLEEVFSEPEDVVVTLLLDSSGSVANDYEELRKIALTLIEKLKGMMIQVVHFATTVETVCPFTTDTKVLTSTVRGMRHLNGSTNMYDAFMHVHDSLMRIVVEDTKPIVFLITDGEPTGRHPREAINKLLSLRPKPQVLGVGIGAGVSVDRLSSLLPGQRVFHLTNYTGLNTTLKSFTQKAELQPAIRIEFRPVAHGLQTSKSDLTLSFDAEPDEPLTRLPAGTVIKFISNAFFFGETVELDTEARRNHPATGQVTLKVKPAARHFGQFPERIIFEAQIPGSPRGKYRGSVSMLMGWLAGDFIYEREPRRPINILIWGGMGCGKTSFINGVFNLFRGMQNIKKELIAFRSQEHVTRAYSRNAVADFLEDDIPVEAVTKANLQLVLWDTWGMSGSNYKTLKVNHFIEGRIYPKTVMHDSDDQTSNQPVDEYVIDAVIMLIPIGTAHMPNKMEELKSHITTVLRKNIRPVIVVNFLNTVSSEEEIEQDFQEIYKASQLSTTDLFRLDNYDNEEYRNMAKDLQYWRILQKAFTEAKKNIEARSRHSSSSSSPGGGARPTMPTPHHHGERPLPADGTEPHVPGWLGTPSRGAAGPPRDVNLPNRRSVPFNQPPTERVDSPQPDKPNGSATKLINVTVNVSGRSSPVRANTRQTVRDIVEDALESLRLPVEDANSYQVFDASGSFVSMRKSVGDILKDGDLLHLTREA